MPNQNRRDFLKTVGTATAAAHVASAAGQADGYAVAVNATPGLVGYWRFEGDLSDAKGRAPGTPIGGDPQFGEGVIGRALVLDGERFITLGEAPHLDLAAATVELFFNLPVAPPQGYNPCLIAKRSSSPDTRFSLHVMRGLDRLALWNGRGLSFFAPVDGPVRPGRWYHLAVASSPAGLKVWLDGVRCVASGGAAFRTEANGLPVQFGASSPAGEERCICSLDEVAVYDRALSDDQVAAHIDAAGWGDKRRGLIEEQRRRREEQERLRQEALERRLHDPRLMARGATRVYAGEHLGAISFPLGGVGSGAIRVNGRAELEQWQLFGNFNALRIPHSFLAVRAAQGGRTAVRALQTAAVGPFPAMAELTFRGELPFAWFDFSDPELPVRVSLAAFNPLLPLNARDSAIPCGVFTVEVSNPTDQPVSVGFLASQQNAAGHNGQDEVVERSCPAYGGNVGRVLSDAGGTLLHLASERGREAGDLALWCHAAEATGAASWSSLDALLQDFAADGRLDGPEQAGPSPAGETLDGALAVGFDLAPGQRRAVTFVLAWYFPAVTHGAPKQGWTTGGWEYETHWASALEVARDVAARLDELTATTRLYHDTLYESNLPWWLLDRISSQVGILRSPTCFWGRDGYFGGWEGSNPGGGCCMGNCGHVWHYAQAHARLFPSVARKMREEVLGDQRADGSLPFRQPSGGIACDAQCGEVLETLREHQTGLDGTWLAEQWPRVKRAMDFAVTAWDPDEDGVLAGPQHNTLDVEIGGSSSWLGSMYLAALRAAAQIAELQGETATAERYRRIGASGEAKQNETLWNGEYYIQLPDEQPQRDYANGCHIDQMLGQWWATQLGLGELYPADRVRTALASLLKYNFRGNFAGVVQVPRKFVADEDAGLQMICWPHDDRPANHTLYADEAMTGFEYAAAAAMVQAGLLQEGLAVVLAISDRYDGRLRQGLALGTSGNPFGDDECGRYYARAMSVWSLLTACQGFVVDGPAQTVGFKPVWQPADHVSFFTAAEGWGLFRQRREGPRQTAQLELREGRLRLQRVGLAVPAGTRVTEAAVRLGDAAVEAKVEQAGVDLALRFAAAVEVKPAQTLAVELTLATR